MIHTCQLCWEEKEINLEPKLRHGPWNWYGEFGGDVGYWLNWAAYHHCLDCDRIVRKWVDRCPTVGQLASEERRQQRREAAREYYMGLTKEALVDMLMPFRL